jgi:DNA helicase-2/ATP-dependent DNA helicase PcrA
VPQHSRTEKNGGTVCIFVGDTKTGSAEKFRAEAKCATTVADETGDIAWQEATRSYKTLAHKLAAMRGNFLPRTAQWI